MIASWYNEPWWVAKQKTWFVPAKQLHADRSIECYHHTDTFYFTENRYLKVVKTANRLVFWYCNTAIWNENYPKTAPKITQILTPPPFACCAQTDAEMCYAQIEKELWAVVYGLEKFHTYTYGRSVAVQSDHKPLEMIFKKSLHKAPKRMLMLTQLHNIKLNYRQGSTRYLADAFKPCVPSLWCNTDTTAEAFESVNMVEDVRVKPATLQEIRDHTEQDEVLSTGWWMSSKQVGQKPNMKSLTG